MSKKALPVRAITLGCDPELFLVDAAGALVSSIGRIGGSKENPRPLPIGDGFAVQEDNVALEYNIPPSASEQEFVKNIIKATKYLAAQVGKQGLKFSDASAVFFPKEQLNNPAALTFGCDPDYNAWTQDVNPKPKADDPTLRSCGGHIHVGHHVDNVYEAVKRCDLYLAVASVFMDKGHLRKQLYGKWGAFRPKPYGFEYRVLSNFWTFSPELIQWAWRNTMLALESTVDANEEKTAICDAVNNNNVEAARYLVDKYNIPMI